MKRRNEHSRALFHRAGNAGVAVAVDTRPNRVPSKRRPGGRPKHKKSQKEPAVFEE